MQNMRCEEQELLPALTVWLGRMTMTPTAGKVRIRPGKAHCFTMKNTPTKETTTIQDIRLHAQSGVGEMLRGSLGGGE